MVSYSRAPARTDQLRPLKLPHTVDVIAINDRPAVFVQGSRRYRIAEIQDEWRVIDEWWREPIARHYYWIALETGDLRTIYHDLIKDTWYEQMYSEALGARCSISGRIS